MRWACGSSGHGNLLPWAAGTGFGRQSCTLIFQPRCCSNCRGVSSSLLSSFPSWHTSAPPKKTTITSVCTQMLPELLYSHHRARLLTAASRGQWGFFRRLYQLCKLLAHRFKWGFAQPHQDNSSSQAQRASYWSLVQPLDVSSPPASSETTKGSKIDVFTYFTGLGPWCLAGPKQPLFSADGEVETSPAFLPKEYQWETLVLDLQCSREGSFILFLIFLRNTDLVITDKNSIRE